MHIFVARHGQTQWNAENKVCGRTDLPLTALGLAQAEELADKVGPLNIDLILCSPMLRARQTAQASASRYGIPMEIDPRLIEQDYGVFEGADRFDPGFWANKRQFAVRYPGGESMMQVAARVYSLLEEIRVRYPNKKILLVCHGGICRVIRTYFEDMTNEDYVNYCEDNAAVREYRL